MESKIILSLSSYRSDARTYQFRCPGNTVQKGSQTNEAPVKYLLKKNPAIRQILCLVTPTAQKTALAHFRQEIAKAAPQVRIDVIDAPDTGKLPDETIAALTREMKPGDIVYLDSSGGTRYTIMGLLQLVRTLEFKGIRLGQVVYANLSSGQGPTIDDVTDLYRTLDLISGMQELADFGSVSSLRAYFRKDPSADAATMVDLLNAIEQMTDAITLCRLGVLENTMKTYREAIDKAQTVRSPVMRELVSILREKFGDNVSTTWLIRWCLDHKMLTQALSLYREWMPAYILRDSGLFTAVPALPDNWTWITNRYQDSHVFQWTRLLNLAMPQGIRRFNMQYTIQTIRDLDRLMPGSGYAVTDMGKLRRTAWDFLYIQCMRNMVLHGNEAAPVDARLRQCLEENGYNTDFEKMSVADMLLYIRQALKSAESL